LCWSKKSIYVARFSIGVGMCNYVCCFFFDVISTSAPSAFNLVKEIVDDGKSKLFCPFPILNFCGTQDPIVMYNDVPFQVVRGKPINFIG